MARGKEAAASARRREQEAQTRAEELEHRLEAAKEGWREETARLREEIIQLRSGINKHGAALAEERISEIHDRMEMERKAALLAEERRGKALDGKDDLVRNACRYLSMRDGIPPGHALLCVLTWVTGQDMCGISDPDALLDHHDLPRNGWAGKMLRRNASLFRLVAQGKKVPGDHVLRPVSLDTAEGEPEKFQINKAYRSEWYRQD